MKSQEWVLDTRGIKRQKNAKYIVSYGGGVNSTALIIYLVKNKFPLDHVVFSDTGDEMPETYEYVQYLNKYLKRHGVPLDIVRPNSTLSEVCTRRKVVPSQVWRWCTRDHKVKPIHKFYKKLNSHIYQYMGIDYGELRRMKPSGEDWITNLYPLIDFKIDRQGCLDLIRKARLKIPIKSGCYLCPYNNMERWGEIYKNHPDLFQKAMQIEEQNKHMPRQKLAPRNYTLRDMEKQLKDNQKLPMIEVDSPCGSECMI